MEPVPLMDPWDWGIDQVIRSLCRLDGVWATLSHTPILPDFEAFEAKLRENAINGMNLLSFVDDTVLRHELGISVFGQRGSIMHVITRLRAQSQKYQEHNHLVASVASRPARMRPALGAESHRTRQLSVLPQLETSSSNLYNQLTARPTADETVNAAPNSLGQQEYPMSTSLLLAKRAYAQSEPTDEPSTSLFDEVHATHGINAPSPNGKKRRRIRVQPQLLINPFEKLSNTSNSNELQSANSTRTFQQSNAYEKDSSNLSPHSTAAASKSSVDGAPSINGTESNQANTFDEHMNWKEKSIGSGAQIQPQVSLSSSVSTVQGEATLNDQGHYNSTGQAQTILGRSILISSSEDNPGVTGQDHAGATPITSERRVGPTDCRNEFVFWCPSEISHNKQYLGPDGKPVDTVFYGDGVDAVPVGGRLDIEDDEECPYSVSLTQKQKSASLSNGSSRGVGIRRYVARLIRRSILSNAPRTIRQGRQRLHVYQPYPARLALDGHAASCSLFTFRSPLKPTATRENMAQLSNDTLNLGSSYHDIEFADDTPNAPQASAREKNDIHEYDHLNKWNLTGDDSVLPAWGQSDQEDEYDSDTWREMQAEQTQVQKHREKGMKEGLSRDEILAIYETSIGQLVDNWKQKKLPRRNAKAWSVWNKARCEGTKKSQIARAQALLEILDQKRIPKLKANIVEQSWMKKSEVRKQCASVQQSVFEREDQRWLIELLSDKNEPAQPGPNPVPKISRSLTKYIESDDELSLESESGQEESFNNEHMLEEFDIEGGLCGDAESTQRNQGANTSGDVPRYHPAASTSRPRKEEDENSKQISKIDDENPFEDPNKATTSQKCRTRRRGFSADFVDELSGVGSVRSNSTSSSVYSDVEEIAQKSFEYYERRVDRKRLLIKLLEASPPAVQRMAAKRAWQIREADFRREIFGNLSVILSGQTRMMGVNESDFCDISKLASFYISWCECEVLKGDTTWPLPVIRNRAKNTAPFSLFYRFLQRATRRYKAPEDFQIPPVAERQRGQRGWKYGIDSSGSVIVTTGKRDIIEDSEARKIREADHRRLEDQRARKRNFERRLGKMGASVMKDPARIIINIGKMDYQPAIYLHPHIGSRIKEHQVEGVQFMWQAVVREGTSAHGCLLAHEMGLGKTMQVISLLVTITLAAKSPDLEISSQVPDRLKQPRFLVLCPPSVSDNWYEEMIGWTPDNVLGTIRKLDAQRSRSQTGRLAEISSWFEEGGVLIMGYQMFRDLISNPKSSKGPSGAKETTFTSAQRLKAKDQLLEGANIVIADEAHILKNPTAQITQATSQFKTLTRIALTGSPLANNVEEYYSTISWIAPNYLGPKDEFQAKYIVPINLGLFQDSTESEQRMAVTMLTALANDLEPKVSRASISVLSGQLPPKIEFVIQVPLTPLQKTVYSIYTGSAFSYGNDSSHSFRILGFLGVLSLLCGHPKCLQDKLRENHSKAKESHHSDETLAEEDKAPIVEVGLSDTVKGMMLEALATVGSNVKDPKLSYKVYILEQILDAAKAAGDKTLVFSQKLRMLDYLENLFKVSNRRYQRLDGSTKMSSRQSAAKSFGEGIDEVYLISTTAGGLGLNIAGANRVVLMDFSWNPTWEVQAIGRAYRIGQKKPVFVYHLHTSGTFEDTMNNQSVFKRTLACGVVDKRQLSDKARKNVATYVTSPKDLPFEDLAMHKGKDPLVLDKILSRQDEERTIRNIRITELPVDVASYIQLTAEEKERVAELNRASQLQRSDPEAYSRLQAQARVPVVPSEQTEPRRNSSTSLGVIGATSTSANETIDPAQLHPPGLLGPSSPTPSSRATQLPLGLRNRDRKLNPSSEGWRSPSVSDNLTLSFQGQPKIVPSVLPRALSRSFAPARSVSSPMEPILGAGTVVEEFHQFPSSRQHLTSMETLGSKDQQRVLPHRSMSPASVQRQLSTAETMQIGDKMSLNKKSEESTIFQDTVQSQEAHSQGDKGGRTLLNSLNPEKKFPQERETTKMVMAQTESAEQGLSEEPNLHFSGPLADTLPAFSNENPSAPQLMPFEEGSPFSDRFRSPAPSSPLTNDEAQ